MTTERIDIIVREDGSRVVKRDLSAMGTEAERTADSIDILKTALVGLVAAFSFQKFAEYTGVWTDLNARVARFAGTAANTEAVMGRLMNIAQRTYAPLESTAEIYLENAFALESLGKSAAQSLDYTEAMTNALVVSGAKGQRAETVIRALSKAMLEGHLSGENWNTVLQQGGRVVEALTEETGLSLRELDRMARSRELSADTVFTALTDQLEQLREEADEMPATIEDAFIRMRNRIVQVLGELDTKLGASQGVVRFMDLLNDHMDVLLPAFVGLGAAIAVAFAPMVIMQFMGALRALFAMAMAHPFVAIAAAVTGVVTALFLMRDQIKLGIDDTTTLGDLMRAVWEGIAPIIQTVAEVASNVFGFITEELVKSTRLWLGITEQYQTRDEATWLKLVRVVAQVFDMIGAVIRATMLAIGRTIGTVIGNAVTQFQDLGRMASSVLKGEFGDAADIAAGILSRGRNDMKDIGAMWGQTFKDEFASQATGGLEAMLDRTLARAKEIGEARRAAQEGANLNTPTTPPGVITDPEDAKKAARELERLQNALIGVLDAADPLGAAHRRLAEAQDILNKSVKAHLLTQQEADDVYAALADRMRDQLDPLGAMNDELDESIALLQMSTRERQVEISLLQVSEQLRRSGVTLTQEETAALRAKLVVEQELHRIAQQRDILQQESMANRRGDLLGSVGIASDMVGQDGFTARDAVGSLSSQIPGLEHTQAALELQREQYALYYEAIDMMREEDLLSEQDAAIAKQAIFQQQYAAQFQAASDALGALTSLQRSENKKQAEIGKAAAIAQTIINTYQAATGAYSAMASIPYVGPFLGAAAAAAAVVAGMANVSAIRSQQTGFRTGGSMVVGGHGGADSQQVAFRATPGERVTVHTPAQARALERLGEAEARGPARGDFTQNVTIVQQGRPDRRTNEQQARALRKQTRAEYERSVV